MNLKISRRRIIVLILLLAAAGSGGFVFYENTKVVPDQLLREALENTFNAQSYTFSVKSNLVVDGKQRALSDIEGEKDKEGNYHIKGTMLKQAVEVYQIENTTYFKEEKTDKWMVIENNNIMDMEQFITEVNPLSNFNFTIPPNIDYLGKEEIDGRKCVVLSCMPDVENQILELHWNNFKYKLWVDKGKKIIRQAEVMAESKNDSGTTLCLNVELKDTNKGGEISPPEIKKES